MLRVLIYLLNSIRFNKSLNKTDLPRKMLLPLLMELVGKAYLAGEWRRLTSKWNKLTHCGRVTQICVFNTVKLGTSASSP